MDKGQIVLDFDKEKSTICMLCNLSKQLLPVNLFLWKGAGTSHKSLKFIMVYGNS